MKRTRRMLNEKNYVIGDIEFSDVTSQGGMLSYSFVLDSDDEDDFVPFNVNVYVKGNKIEDIVFYDFIKDEILNVAQAAEEFGLDDEELNKIIQDAREEAEEYLLHRSVKETHHIRGRMLKEDEEEGSKVIARQKFVDSDSSADDCSYDEILVFMDDEYRPGSGHSNRSCMKYADEANRLKDEFDDLTEEEQNEYDNDVENYVREGMGTKFGGEWDCSSITGSVQGEWYRIIYPKTASAKHLKYFENAFFGRGWDYECYQDDEYLVNVFVNEMDEDQTKEIIADACGCDEEDIVIEYAESRRLRGRMLKEEDERVSLDVSYSDEWSEDGEKHVDLDIKKNGKNTPIKVMVVFTDKGKHLNTIFSWKKTYEDLTENEVAEELDVSVGDIRKLAEKAKIKAKCR